MIKIIQTGKIPKEYQILIDDFIKKIRPYDNVNVISLKEVKLKEDDSNLGEKLAVETQKALNQADGDVFILDANGKNPNSSEFMEIVKSRKNIGRTISFVIGGSNGFDHNVIKSYEKISLGRMTLLHHMTILILVEAIYRSYKMMQNSDYNK